MAILKFKRGSRAQLQTAAAASGLIQGEPYLVTDADDDLAVGKDTSSFFTLGKALWERPIFLVSHASGTTAPNVIGGTLTTANTLSAQQTIASANPWQATQRKRFQTSTTAGNASGMRTAYVQWFRGNAAGFGGFTFRAKFGQSVNTTGAQLFIGLCAATGALAGDPSALVNMCGVGYDAGDASTGNWFFMRNDGTGTATRTDLGATNAVRNTTHGYELFMYMAPNGSELFVRITNLHNGAEVLNTSYTTDLPAVNTGMAFSAQARNGALTSAVNIEVSTVYIESNL